MYNNILNNSGSGSGCGGLDFQNIQTCPPTPCQPTTKCVTTTSVVVKKTCGNDTSLVGLQPGGPNQVLITDDTGTMTWQDQCSFNGVENFTSSIKGGGLVVNTGAGTDCFRTLVPPQNDEIPIYDSSGNLTWISVSDLLGSVAFNITTSDGLSANGTPGGVLSSSGTLGLDSWEINPTTKSLRPKTNLVGSLGDNLHVISSGHLVNLNLYNGVNAHTITTAASSAYSWRTPSSNPAFTSLIQDDTSGNLSYLSASSSSQVLVTGPGNVPIWIEQCTFDGMNINALSVPFNNSGSTISGVLVNNGNSSSCMRTLNPGASSLSSANKVLVTDGSGSMTWINQSALIPPLSTGTVTLVGTSDGLTVGGIPGASITVSGTLGLDGWEIVDGSKILRPKTGFTGKLGDPSHIVFNAHLNNLLLYNGLNAHTIITAASGSYSWRTPSNNPSVLSLVNCDTSGNLGYYGPANADQVLVSSGWIDQCAFAGLNNIVSITSIGAPDFVGAGAVVNVGTASNCLETVRPGTTAGTSANKVFVTDGTGNMTWILQTALPNAGGGGGVSSVTATDGIFVNGGGGPANGAVTLSLDGWEIVNGSKILRPKTGETGKLGDSTHVVNEIYDTTLKMVGSNSNIVSIGANAVTTNYSLTLPTQINPSFNNNSVLSTTNTGVMSFLTKLQCDNVTMPYNFITAMPLASPYNITTLNTVYEFDLSLLVGLSLTVIIPDASVTNQGYSVVIYKKSTDTKTINVVTVGTQNISALANVSLSNQGDTVFLSSINAIAGWVVLGTNSTAQLNFIVNFSQKIFSASYSPLVSTSIIGSGNQTIVYDTITDSSLTPIVVYNSLTGVFTFAISGRYTFWILQTIAFNSSGAQGNAHSKISIYQGTDATGIEVTESPGLFYNNKTEAGRYAPALLSLERSVNVTALLPYVIAFKIVTEDDNGIVEFSPNAILPGNGVLPLISGSIEIRRLP